MIRLLKAFLLFFPADFRHRFGPGMVECVVADLSEARKRGRVLWALALARQLWDLALSGIQLRVAAGFFPGLAGHSPREVGSPLGASWRDLRFALRALRRRPGFTLAAVVIMGLGILVNVSVFSITMATLFPRTGGVEEPDRLVALFQYATEEGYHSSLSLPTYLDYRDGLESVEGLAAYAGTAVNLTTVEGSYRLQAQLVSQDFFQLLGVEPVLGRGFVAPERQTVDDRSVVLSHGLWQELFGSRNDVLGSTVHLGEGSFTVVGVAPREFRGLDLEGPADLWVPLEARGVLTSYSEEMIEKRGMHWLSVVGRLKTGATQARATGEADAMARALAAANPVEQGGWDVRVLPLHEAVIWPSQRDGIRQMAWILGVVVVLILLLTCVTLASMALAEVVARRDEGAIRLALGAGRTHLVRQELVQAVLITLAALALGLVGGRLVMGDTAVWSLIPQLPPGLELNGDGRILVALVLLAPILTLLVGTLPALQASRVEPGAAMMGGRQRGSLRRVGRLRRFLSALQVGISVAVLTAAGTLAKSALAQISHDLGFEPQGVLLASVDLQLSGYDEEARRDFYRRGRELLSQLPGVNSVAVSAFVPLSGPRLGAEVRVFDAAGGEQTGRVTGNVVSPGYNQVLGIPLSAGRDFGEMDSEALTPVVVNQAAARQFWGTESVVGRELDLGEFLGGRATVVGVARDLGAGRSLYPSPRPSVFVPLWHRPWGSGTFQVRVERGNPLALAGEVRTTLASLDPSVPIYDVRSLESLVDSAITPALALAGAVAILGVLGLLLAAAGIYGVVAHSVSRRLHEFGVRIAVGADGPRILGEVLREGVVVFGGGLLLGIPGAFMIGRLLESGLFGVEARDPASLGLSVLLTASATLLALILPARRAAAVDPAEALRG